jgi:hypothetical protein
LLGVEDEYGKTSMALQIVRALVANDDFLDWTGSGGRVSARWISRGIDARTVQDPGDTREHETFRLAAVFESRRAHYRGRGYAEGRMAPWSRVPEMPR